MLLPAVVVSTIGGSTLIGGSSPRPLDMYSGIAAVGSHVGIIIAGFIFKIGTAYVKSLVTTDGELISTDAEVICPSKLPFHIPFAGDGEIVMMELLFREHLDKCRREALGIGNGTTLGNGLGIGNRDGALLGEILVDGAALAKALGIGDGVALGETLERADDGAALGE
eukprot:scaffold5009_cov113-Cylindrotheca_fusiformis.AAC.2